MRFPLSLLFPISLQSNGSQMDPKDIGFLQQLKEAWIDCRDFLMILVSLQKKTDTNGICMVNSFSPKLNCWRIRTPSTVWHLTIYGVCWKITQTLSMGSNHSLGLAFLGTYTGGRCWCCDQAPGASGCQHETWQSEPGLYFLQETEAIVQYFPPSYPSFKINL